MDRQRELESLRTNMPKGETSNSKCITGMHNPLGKILKAQLIHPELVQKFCEGQNIQVLTCEDGGDESHGSSATIPGI